MSDGSSRYDFLIKVFNISCPNPSISNAFLDTKCVRFPFIISGQEKDDEHFINAALFFTSFSSKL